MQRSHGGKGGRADVAGLLVAGSWRLYEKPPRTSNQQHTLGQTVTRTIDTAGTLLERTVDRTGKPVGEKRLGRVLDLPLVNETKNAAGQTDRTLRDTTGALIEVTLDAAGKIVSSRPAPRQ